uniref:Uncharacterized protein n=1 Tax=Physcomitrium patens TaxID=3218 RepID=A0A2K1KN14_PHYPA|nr:hypothetical protein PHYPA_006064 [Physcomitrium patens]
MGLVFTGKFWCQNLGDAIWAVPTSQRQSRRNAFILDGNTP